MGASPLPASDKTDFLASIFDALPIPALVVDSDVRIFEFNLAAARMLEKMPSAILHPSAGEALHCIHSTETPKGCGHSGACHDCVIRNSVKEVFGGGKPGRKLAHMSLIRDNQPADTDLLVTVASVPDEDEPLALLILDSVSELSALLNPASSFPDSRVPAKAPVHRKGNS